MPPTSPVDPNWNEFAAPLVVVWSRDTGGVTAPPPPPPPGDEEITVPAGLIVLSEDGFVLLEDGFALAEAA